MKKFIFPVISLLLGSLLLISCSKDEDSLFENEAQDHALSRSEDEKVAELILFMNDAALQFSSYNDATETKSLRGFFRWLGNVIKSDAYGYLWGLGRGYGFTGSLVPGVACSINAAIHLSDDNDMTTRDWVLARAWNSLSATSDFQRIGYDHNRSIYEMYTNDPLIFTNPYADIYKLSVSTLGAIGYRSSFSQLDYNTLLNSLKMSYDHFESYVRSILLDTNYSPAISVIEEYADNVLNFSDVSQIKDYNNLIYKQIDQMGFTQSKAIKAAIAICGNSRILWQEK